MGYSLTKAFLFVLALFGAVVLAAAAKSAESTTVLTKSPPGTFSTIACTKAAEASPAMSPRDRKPIICGRTTESFEVAFDAMLLAINQVDEHLEMALEDAADAYNNKVNLTAIAAR